MNIKQLEIRNFKSIKNLILNPSNLCSIVGPNSSGKTNILKAIDLVLGEGWATKAKVARELFNDIRENIFIKIDFDEEIKWSYYGRQYLINSVTLDMSFEPLDCKVRLWSNYPEDNKGAGFYLNEEFKKSCHFIYIPSERQLSSELRVSEWTMLGKLMRLVYENYILHKGNEENLKQEFSDKIQEAKKYLEDDFAIGEVTFKKFADSFAKHCKKNSSGFAIDFEPILNIYNLNWFYKTLQINVKEEMVDKHFNSEDVGAGMQNLLLISIFQTYAELMGGKVIFGLEEPEIYLYPHAQRSLYKNLIELSHETQILYTTHSPNFLDASRPDDIQIIRKDISKGTYRFDKQDYFNNENAEKEKHKIYTHFNPERNEMFFANKILLVEGHSDKICFVNLCTEKWNIDLDQNGYSIIECGGKSGVNYFVGVCKLIGQNNYLAVWDEDDGDYDPEKEFLSTIKNTDCGLEITENLEKFLGLPISKNSDKVKNAYEWSQNVVDDKIPRELQKIKAFFSGDDAEKSKTKRKEKSTAAIKTVKTDEIEDIPF